MEAKLRIVVGKVDKSELDIKLPTTLGRSRQADLTVAHSLVSRKHCALIERNGFVVLRDLGSLNGTYVRGQKVSGEVRLLPSDEFSIGPLTFQIDYQQARVSTPTDRGDGGTVAGPQTPGLSHEGGDGHDGPMPHFPPPLPGAKGDKVAFPGANPSGGAPSDKSADPLEPTPSAVKPAIEVDETIEISSPRVAASESDDDGSGLGPHTFRIAPEDGQLPDFSRLQDLRDDTPIPDLSPRPSGPRIPAEEESAADKERKEPDRADAGPQASSGGEASASADTSNSIDDNLRDFLKKFE